MATQARGLLIDTSALVAHFRGEVDLRDIVRRYGGVYVSAVTVYELEYGARRAGRTSDLAAFEEAFQLEVIPLGRVEAERAAALNAELAEQGRRIGDRDALIAATALSHHLDLVTRNVQEFRRVPNLPVVVPQTGATGGQEAVEGRRGQAQGRRGRRR